MSQPNIIFILVDQMRWDCLGANGNSQIETPYLDYIASRGTNFTKCYSTVPSCLPARAMLFTGMNQWETGILGMGRGQGEIPNNYPTTLPLELEKAGYRTHLAGKGHFSPQRTGIGFQTSELDESGRMTDPNNPDDYRIWFDENKTAPITPDDHGVFWNSWMSRPWHTEEYLHPSAWTTSAAIQFLKEQEGSKQPFFLNLSFARPHSPFVPPQTYWELYKDEDLGLPKIGDWAACHDVPEDAANPNAWRGKQSDKRCRRAKQGYYGEISFIDAQIGRLWNYIERYQYDLFDNTIFIFSSDHGEMLGDHNLWRKTYAYEGSTHVPLIITLPERMQQNKTCDAVIGLQDMMPSILDLANVNSQAEMNGHSITPCLNNSTHQVRDYIHGEHAQCYQAVQEMQFVTDGKRKFIWLPHTNEKQFFDLEKDPYECQNLYAVAEVQEEVHLWEQRLIKSLEERNCHWVKDGVLCFDKTHWPLISPHKRN